MAKQVRVRSIRLGTFKEVRQEMAKLYREARANKIEPAEASKLNYMLQGIVKVLEIEDDRVKPGDKNPVEIRFVK